jgi:hypothetical protein
MSADPLAGFYNWAIFVGALIGLFTAGPLSDWISMHLTRKAGGIREPEMRLPAMIPYVLILIIGMAITAVVLVLEDHRDHRLYLPRYSGCSPSCDRFNVRRGFLQARCRIYLCVNYNQQECLGLRIQQVHNSMDHQGWVYRPDHDEYDPGGGVVFVWDIVLVQRQGI